MNHIEKLGWDSSIQHEDNNKLARVIAVQKNSYRISDGEMEYFSHLSGKFMNQAYSSLDFPAVGDWVEVQKLADEQKAVINRILPRKSKFVRQAAGTKTEAQIVAANMDTVFIVNSLNHDLNVRRIERYILSTYESGASPVIVLTKKDESTPEDIIRITAEVEEAAIGVPIVCISSITGEGIEELLTYLPDRKTAALLGSSGVGKSTLVNALLGEKVQETKDIREADSKGRHTTTHREMFTLPNGALLIDTPGMRELQLWDGDGAIDTTFQDVEALADECRFSDCQHDTEPGCRVQEAMDSDELSEERFESYLKLQRELAYEKRKQDQKVRLEEKNKWKKISKDMKNRYKAR
ncbi:ribosome small subunit-dependent GTPase A [Virgibacillus oceani]|uniref:Small ribosomal subunit biogenesis GTPase RsgA n=1 Tax=Virgibacillus oceani TaxID=1479511 RepID=A0A917M6Z9_9BACI|nr:ribosome small subunit-dependent GTPase A [Virgibacillus oceani]GGG81388.1 putative ribosome biogenesis GTPase RsgA [Virgibacillus oceani]